MPNTENTNKLVESVDHLFTTITPGELSVSMEQFMGSAIRDDFNPRCNLAALWHHFEEVQSFLNEMIVVYDAREFTS